MTATGRGTARLRRVAQFVVVLTVAAGLMALPCAPASAMTCPYDTAARTSNVTLSSTDSLVTIRANGPYLEIGNVFCALLSEVNTVNINAAPDPTARLSFDIGSGPFDTLDGGTGTDTCTQGAGTGAVANCEG